MQQTWATGESIDDIVRDVEDIGESVDRDFLFRWLSHSQKSNADRYLLFPRQGDTLVPSSIVFRSLSLRKIAFPNLGTRRYWTMSSSTLCKVRRL